MFRDVIKGDEQNPLFPHAEKVRVRVSDHWNRPCPGPLTHTLSPEGERGFSGKANCKGISPAVH